MLVYGIFLFGLWVALAFIYSLDSYVKYQENKKDKEQELEDYEEEK